jgi:hypothetical protein
MAKQLSYEQIVAIAAREGVKAADRRFEALVKKDRKEFQDHRLRNTKLLLKNYRTFKTHAENSVYKIENCEESVFDVLALMSDRDFYRAESIVESIKKSAERTYIMVEHIDSMLAAYKLMCEKSGKEAMMRQWRVLYSMYIGEEQKYAEEIADEECIDKRTVYKDVDAAAEILTSLLFGVDSLMYKNGNKNFGENGEKP